MKPMQITAEQYLLEQLQQHTTTDPLELILRQLDKQPCTGNPHIIKNGPCTNFVIVVVAIHECSTACKGLENDQIEKEVNSEQINNEKCVISEKWVLVSRDHKS